jgi:hypothetical protein
MLPGVDPPLDGAVVLLAHVVQIWHRSMPAILGENAFGFKPVESAVSTPWSNGPVEGHISRLKILKRQMYGHAGIELLRARLLPEPEFSDPRTLHQNCVRTGLIAKI